MKSFGKLQKIQGNQITIELDDGLNFDKLNRFANGKQANVQIELDDGRKRTLDQLRKAWALIHDVALWSGYDVLEAEAEMKMQYMVRTGREMFSQSDCSVEVENQFITTIIDFCFDNNVPFKTKTWDLICNDYHAVYEATINRRCIICGKPNSDIDHFNSVGMGRNRHKVNPDEFLYWALCRGHHTERHKVGIKTFSQKYQMKPVKLDEYGLKKLKI